MSEKTEVALTEATHRVNGRRTKILVIRTQDLKLPPDPFGRRRGIQAQVEKAVKEYPALSAQRSRHIAWDAFSSYCNAVSNESELAKYALQLMAHHGGIIPAEQFSAFVQRCDELMSEHKDRSASDEGLAEYCITLQLRDFLRKSCIVPDGPDFANKHDTAERNFFIVEQDMGDANERIRRLFFSVGKRQLSELETTVVLALEYAHNYIGRHLRKPNMVRLADDCTFGPGTSIGTSRSIIEKIGVPGDGVSVSATLQPHAAVVLTKYFPGWVKQLAWGGLSQSNIEEEPRSGFITFNIPAGDEKFSSVLKDWNKNRPISVQATINGFFQSAIGREHERVCARMGNPIRGTEDVDDTQAINKALALQASKDGGLATADFSEASDRIAQRLVEWVFGGLAYGSDPNTTSPHAVHWLRLMDLCRAHTICVGKKTVVLERFSAMGNGFTFPLMTMIFLALARYATHAANEDPRRVRVFGDDVLLPTAALDGFLRITEYLGMLPNRKKTFGSGPFRESCGMDAYNGIQITPYRVTFKEENIHDVDTVISLANGLYRSYNRGSGPDCHRVGLLGARQVVLDAIPRVALNNLCTARDLGDSNVIGFHPVQVLQRNKLLDLYWNGIGLTPVLIRVREQVHLSKSRKWTAHKAYASFIYNARPHPRSLGGSFMELTDKEDVVLAFAPRLGV